MISLLRLAEILALCALLSFQDIRSRMISVPALGIGFLLQIVLILLESNQPLAAHLINSLLLSLFYLLQSRFIKGKFASGDILFSAFSGLCICGWNHLWIAIFLPPFLAILVLLPFYLSLLRKKPARDFLNFKLPFIPFMSAGLLCAAAFEFLMTKSF